MTIVERFYKENNNKRTAAENMFHLFSDEEYGDKWKAAEEEIKAIIVESVNKLDVDLVKVLSKYKKLGAADTDSKERVLDYIKKFVKGTMPGWGASI